MELEQYLQELLSDLDAKCQLEDASKSNYFDLIASKSTESLLSFNGVKILPPILSEVEKQTMQEYRRRAVKLEQKHFEARRKKYSSLVLQVIELTDKYQGLEGTRNGIDEPTKQPLPVQPSKDRHQERSSFPANEASKVTPKQLTTKSRGELGKENSKPDDLSSNYHESIPSKEKEISDRDELLSTIFQKPKLHHSLSSSQSQNKAKRPVHSSLHSDIASENSMVRSSGRESADSFSSTLKMSQQNYLRETIDSRKEFQPSDSLASTVLSMAFTDSSFASQHSAATMTEQPNKSAQRQLNMDNANHNLYESYHHKANPLTSTPTGIHQPAVHHLKMAKNSSVSGHPKDSGQVYTKGSGKEYAKDSGNVYSKDFGQVYEKGSGKLYHTKDSGNVHSKDSGRMLTKGSGKIYSNGSGKVYTKADSQQDKALEKLELMRQKLLQEKEKQMVLLRQQELARIRKGKEHTELGHYSQGALQESSQGHISSRAGSDMYAIPEQSFEGTSSFAQQEHNDMESASDKENIIYKLDSDVNLHYEIGNQLNSDSDTLYGNEHQHKLEEKYSGDIDSRPISVHSKQNIGKQNRRRSSLYIRQEFEKQVEMEMSKETNGKDKFSILTAYAKGFITRRLLQTEKVQAIVKTIKDTSEFLADISKEGTVSYQDKSLQERVQAQLLAARSKLYDIFFTIPIHERMIYIAHSRNAAREREDRMNAKKSEAKQLTRKLSAATMKAMQRRQEETNSASDSKKPSQQSQYGKRNIDTRALKPVQSIKSPQGPSRSQAKRRSLASPLARRSIGKKLTNSRPSTATGTRLPTNRKSSGRMSLDADKLIRQQKTSLDNRPLSTKRLKSNDKNENNNNSKLPVKKSGSLTYRVSKDDLTKDVHRTRPATATAASRPSSSHITDTRPNTAVGTRRVTRSMAAQFTKK